MNSDSASGVTAGLRTETVVADPSSDPILKTGQKPRSAWRGDLRLRTVSSMVLVPAVATVVLLGGVVLFLALVIVAALMAWEWGALIATAEASRMRARFALLVAGCVPLAAAFLTSPQYGVFLAVGASVAALILGRMIGVRNGLWAAAAVVSIAFPAIALTWMRGLPEFGLETVIWALATVVLVDIGAYAAGRTIGGPRLWPRVSPSKTWAGLMGGGVGAVVVAVITTIVVDEARMIVLLPLAIVLALTAQAGDLLESSVKRRFHVKDSGALIPGHGGVLDRVDGHVTVLTLTALAVWLSHRSVLEW